MKLNRISIISGLILLVLFLSIASLPVAAVPPAPGTVFDDFEDNDASDWGFFGGNAAGGGGGTADDRPAEGSYYFSTGWGGNGTASSFYGGAFKNLPDGFADHPAARPLVQHVGAQSEQRDR